MGKLSKEELQALANETMEFNKVSQCFVTCDGQAFLRKNTAGVHAIANQVKVHTFGEAEKVEEPKAKLADQSMRIAGNPAEKREESTEASSESKAPKAADQISAIEKAKTASEVSEILGTDQRKSVKKAAEKRLGELKSIGMRGDEVNADEATLQQAQDDKKEVDLKISAMNDAEDVETLDALFGADENEEVKKAYEVKLATFTPAPEASDAPAEEEVKLPSETKEAPAADATEEAKTETKKETKA